jgi:hypothetical protein
MGIRNGAIAAMCSMLLAACGGGGGGIAANPPAVGGPPPPPQPPPVGNNLPGPRPVAEPQTFVAYESGQVRPLALSADGQRLYP